MLFAWTQEHPGAVVTDDAWFAGEVYDAAVARRAAGEQDDGAT